MEQSFERQEAEGSPSWSREHFDQFMAVQREFIRGLAENGEGLISWIQSHAGDVRRIVDSEPSIQSAIESDDVDGAVEAIRVQIERSKQSHDSRHRS